MTNFSYFKPPEDAFLSELKAKDWRSAKDCEYINTAAVWLDMGISAMFVSKKVDSDHEKLGRILALAESFP